MQDPEHLPNWQRLSARITTSGQPGEADLDALKAIGVRHVVNLALHEHPRALPDEAASVAARGMRYVHIPVPFDAPDDEHFAAFRMALADAGDDPVHVHCIVNWRVSAFFYRYHRDLLGMDEAEARALMERQWSPERSGEKAAPIWVEFIA